MAKVLISDRTHEVLEKKFREAGIEVSVEPGHDYESLVAAAQGYEGRVTVTLWASIPWVYCWRCWTT